jgi:hypothetical protein
MVMTNVGAPLRVGSADGKGNAKGNGAGGIESPIYVYQITPSTGTTVTIAAAQAVAGAANLTINGSLATAGVATLDVPRNVIVISSSGTDSTQTATVYGTDTYAIPVVETITLTGTTSAKGLKAFKTVTRVAMSASTSGNISAGSGDKFGVPYRINKLGSMQAFWDATWNSGSATTTLGSTSTATATTGDVRGTYLPATASDGVRTLALWIYADDVDTNNGLYGVDQYGG